MFIDASALTALLTEEDDARELLSRLQLAKTRLTSPLAVWEATIAVARVLDLAIGDTSEALERYLTLMGIELVSVPPRDDQDRDQGLRSVWQGPASSATERW